MTIKFGTDGWRGVIAEDFTFANVRACAQGLACYLLGEGVGGQGVVVGYDTRFASEDFAQAAAQGLAAYGLPVFLTPRPTPTPVVAFGILEKGAGAGVIITASHNPSRYNGFKVRTGEAMSVPPEVASRIEALIAQAQPPPPHPPGPVESYDPRPSYLQHLSSLIDLEGLRGAPLKLVADPMFGAGMGYLPQALAGGRLEVTEVHAQRHPLFPGLVPEPIPPNLKDLCQAVRGGGANIGVATDGDADRVGVVDELGNPLSASEAFALLALYWLEVRGRRGPIIRSLPSTAMLDRLGERFGVPVVLTPVGFKYVAPLLVAQRAILGGEESGGYGFPGHPPERDGILSALCFLDLMVKTGKKLSALVEYLYGMVGRHYYRRLDLPFPSEEGPRMRGRLEAAHPSSLDGVRVCKKDTRDGFYFSLEEGSWLLVRFSGTEPLMRVYAESPSPARVEALLKAGREMAGV